MSLFLRLLEDEDKAEALRTALRAVAAGEPDRRVFEADPEAFALVPGGAVCVLGLQCGARRLSRLGGF